MLLSIKEISLEFKIKISLLRKLTSLKKISCEKKEGRIFFDREVFEKEWDEHNKKSLCRKLLPRHTPEGFIHISDMARLLGVSHCYLNGIILCHGIEKEEHGLGLVDKKYIPYLQGILEAKKALKEAIKNKPE